MPFLIILALLPAALWAYLRFNPQFGGRVSAENKKRYAESPNWKNNQFENLTETSMSFDMKKFPEFLRKQVTEGNIRKPKKTLPIKAFDKVQWQKNPEKPKFIWYGHSVLLLQIANKNFLIDPMLGPDASPVGPVRTRRFSENTLDIIDTLPPLDAVLLTHDHYDHLDYASILKLKDKVSTWFTSLGLGRHLEAWGIPAKQIKEFDWWDKTEVADVEITFTPSRHFSGRGLTDRAKGLWGGWVFQSPSHKIYWSGDGGYEAHFAEVGKRFGGFDWIFVECGQYNENWHAIHNYPEEAVQAGIDAKADILIPVHWGGFALALHTWRDSVERFVKEGEVKGQKVCTPNLGAIVSLGNEDLNSRWYTEYE